ncbi:hypothetical protein J3R30DRAFT_3291275, partial [Lentinula aciculospora]
FHTVHIVLVISQQTPLHTYPTHALSILSSSSTPETSTKSRHSRSSLKTAHLARLTVAHSRFVLVLQTIAHSSSYPPPQESDLLVSPSLDPHRVESSYRSHNRASSAGSVRELVFPAPLAPDHRVIQTSQSMTDLNSITSNPVDKPWTGYPSFSASASTPSISISHIHSIPKSSKRFSMATLLRKSSHMPPPPVVESRALREYSSSFGWRRALHDAKGKWEATIPSHRSTFVGSDLHISGSESSFSEGTSSTTSSSTSASNSTTSASPRERLRSIPSVGGLPGVDLSHNNPHALRLATSRIRAPVLRVFVPSLDMNLTYTTDFMPSSSDEGGVSRCEEELARAGLWEHLSVGDVVCNLGYVPPSISSSTGSSDAIWLIFNGCQLVPYTFGALDSRGILPVYSTSEANDPVSPLHLDVMHQPTLISVPMNIPSPHTPGGMVVVKKWVWTLRVWVGSSSRSTNFMSSFTTDNEFEAETEVGTGWEGEWILEGDGTKEGRDFLLSCLRRDQTRTDMMEWELVRDRCGRSKVWLR